MSRTKRVKSLLWGSTALDFIGCQSVNGCKTEHHPWAVRGSWQPVGKSPRRGAFQQWHSARKLWKQQTGSRNAGRYDPTSLHRCYTVSNFNLSWPSNPIWVLSGWSLRVLLLHLRPFSNFLQQTKNMFHRLIRDSRLFLGGIVWPYNRLATFTQQ